LKQGCSKEFSGGDEARLATALEKVGRSYLLGERRRQKLNEYYYDTFDWSLYAAGYLLKRRGGQLFLGAADGRRMIAGGAAVKRCYFWQQLPVGELRTILQSVAGVRAICEIVAAKVTRSSVDIRNRDRKTIARLQIDETRALGNGREENLSAVVRLKAMKGYEKPFARVVRQLEDAGLVELPDDMPELQRVLAAVGREVLDYSSKYDLRLPRDITLQQAVSSICLYLLDAMEKNVAGVLDDIDSEFLHDFRVAMRRTRSLLSQLKKYLPAETIQHFQNEFKWLGALTGPVRDLDVYLLEKDQFALMLPQQLHGGLEAFFQDLEKSREKKLALLRQGLTSERYTTLLRSWKEFLQNEEEGRGWAMAGEECLPIARRIIRTRYRKILKRGEKIGEHSPDEELHSLRIQGKKLRYLLEFFSSFFVEEEIQHFHKQLKNLQNNLGDFNDVSVQLEMLDYRISSKSRSRRSVEIAAALGGLVTHLAEEQKNIRSQFESTFAKFASPANRNRFNALLE
jgi:CHAD domain-containing protein